VSDFLRHSTVVTRQPMKRTSSRRTARSFRERSRQEQREGDSFDTGCIWASNLSQHTFVRDVQMVMRIVIHP
jgi:hypothetical protein